MRLSSSCCCSCRMRSSRFASSPPPMNSRSATGPSLDARTTSRRVSSVSSSLSPSPSRSSGARVSSVSSANRAQPVLHLGIQPLLSENLAMNEGSRAPRTEGSERVSPRIASPQTRVPSLRRLYNIPRPLSRREQAISYGDSARLLRHRDAERQRCAVNCPYRGEPRRYYGDSLGFPLNRESQGNLMVSATREAIE